MTAGPDEHHQRNPGERDRLARLDSAVPDARDAGASAERGEHFGLLNMQQRAEQIGAILDIRRWPSGGTHVALEWRQR